MAFTSDAFVAVKADRIWLAATRVEDYQPPTWPEAHMPKQMHLDLAVDDLAEAEQQATALGAVRAAHHSQLLSDTSYCSIQQVIRSAYPRRFRSSGRPTSGRPCCSPGVWGQGHL